MKLMLTDYLYPAVLGHFRTLWSTCLTTKAHLMTISFSFKLKTSLQGMTSFVQV